VSSRGFAEGFDKTAFIGPVAGILAKGILKAPAALLRGAGKATGKTLYGAGKAVGSKLMPKTTGGKINALLTGMGALGDYEQATGAYRRAAISGR